MIEYTSKRIVCPHCGHHTRVELDASQGIREFYEDCMACCNPIHPAAAPGRGPRLPATLRGCGRRAGLLPLSRLGPGWPTERWHLGRDGSPCERQAPRWRLSTGRLRTTTSQQSSSTPPPQVQSATK